MIFKRRQKEKRKELIPLSTDLLDAMNDLLQLINSQSSRYSEQDIKKTILLFLNKVKQEIEDCMEQIRKIQREDENKTKILKKNYEKVMRFKDIAFDLHKRVNDNDLGMFVLKNANLVNIAVNDFAQLYDNKVIFLYEGEIRNISQKIYRLKKRNDDRLVEIMEEYKNKKCSKGFGNAVMNDEERIKNGKEIYKLERQREVLLYGEELYA